MVNNGGGRVRLEFRIPSRGLIGFRSQFLTDTRGTGILNHLFDGWEPCARPDRRTRRTARSSPIASACATAFAIVNLQERGEIFVDAGDRRSTRAWSSARTPAENDLDVNITKEKKLTNMRASSADETPSV